MLSPSDELEIAMRFRTLTFVFFLCTSLDLYSQSTKQDQSINAPSQDPSVPLLAQFAGSLGQSGNIEGLHGITFSIYAEQTGGTPLWTETQSVAVDSKGNFSVLLGSSQSAGLPPDVFALGEPRWIGYVSDDGLEQPRIPLSTVPYAFKAANADTLGGMKASDFVSVSQLNSLLNSGRTIAQTPAFPPGTSPIAIPVAISVSAPPGPVIDFARLNEENFFSKKQRDAGGLTLPASWKRADESYALDSAPLDFETTIPDPQTHQTVSQLFRWTSQALSAPAGPSARLALAFGQNRTPPSSTGFSINSDGTINFAPNQQFPQNGVLEALNGGNEMGGTSSTSAIVTTSPYSWTETPTGAALQAGDNIVTLKPCPAGVNGTDVWHYLYISGSGKPEVVLITGGSCVSKAASGTIEFTALYPHGKGYNIASATDGIQEAVINAVAPNTGSTTTQLSRQVVISPGVHRFRARLSIRATSITVSNSGGIIVCAMADTCIMLGDPVNGNLFSDMTLQGLRVAAGVPSGTWPAIEDNAIKSTITDIAPATSPIEGATLGSLVRIDNDQAASITSMDTNTASWARCDTVFCSTAIIGPGPFSTNAGVLWVSKSNLGLACKANGIDNQNGNTLSVKDSVVEAFPEFGVRARTVFNPTTVILNNVYEEVGNCVNPLGTGMAGLIVEGGKATVDAGTPVGQLPLFADTGTMTYYYYVVVHSSTMGTSPAYLAGTATTNGTGQISVVWNQVGTSGTITYDVLRIVGDGGADMHAPSGTGSYAVATGVAATLCANKVCTISDNAASAPASYTVSDYTMYWPSLQMWPGAVILTSASDVQNTGGAVTSQLYSDYLSASTGIVNSGGAANASVFAQMCDPQGNWSSIWMQCATGSSVSNDFPAVVATVLQLSSNGGAPGGLKGRQIFEVPPLSSLAATHVITLSDSNPDKTFGTPGNRPAWDPSDTYIGYDQPTNVSVLGTQLSFGSPVAISQYIANTGDNVHWGERLTATSKAFQVPVQFSELYTGSTANTDLAGVIVVSGETSGSYQFVRQYKTPPSCQLTPEGDWGPVGAYWETVTNASLTANVRIAGTIFFQYHCIGMSAQPPS
jgi:hypothetical protein